MRIHKLEISNILGIKELSFELGKFVEISGKNGLGKTSVIEAIKGALKSGNDASLLKNGAEKGEVVLILDENITIQKTVTESNTKVDFINSDGKKEKAPQKHIDKLFDMLSVNPIQFIFSDRKSRTKIMLEALNLQISKDKFIDILGYQKASVIDVDRNALDVIDGIYQEIFRERTDLNRDAKEKKNSISQLEEAIVEFDFSPENLTEQITNLEAKKDKWSAKKESILSNIHEDSNKKINFSKNKFDEKMNEFRTEDEKKWENLRSIFEQEKEIIRQEKQLEIEALTTQFETSMQPLMEELTHLRSNMKNVGAAQKTKELINQYQKETDFLIKKSQECSEQLDALNSLKLELLETLPIKGLEVREGEIYKDEVIFDRLNTAEQTKIAVEVAKLRAGELGIVCVDGIERLDSDKYEIFKKEMINSGLQTIVTRVSDSELTLKNY